MKFEKIAKKVKNGEIKPRWDLTPQIYSAGIEGVEISSQEDISKLQENIASKAGCYFYVDVWDVNYTALKDGALSVRNNPPDLRASLLGCPAQEGLLPSRAKIARYFWRRYNQHE